MVSSDGIARSWQKQYQYNPTTDAANIITLIDNKLTLINDKVPNPDPTTWVNGFIKVFSCKSCINSLPQIPIPDFQDTDTPAQSLTKQKQVLWDNPAYRLVIYLADPVPTGGTTVWVEKIFYNLQNTFGFPYTTEELLSGLTTDIARDLPEGCKLGIAFKDIGWGLPKAADLITIDIAWSAEYNWIKPYDVNISQPVVVQTATVQQVTQKTDSYTNTRISTTAVQLMAANLNRLSGQIVNSSSNIIYYGLGITPTSTSNSGSVAAGATVPLPAGNKTFVSVIANTGLTNSVTVSETYNAS